LGGLASDSLNQKQKHPHPSPLPEGEGEREQIGGLSDFEFDSILQVGVRRTDTSVSPLSLWERARVRVFLTASHFNRLESLARRLHGQFVPVFTLLEYCL
jgi:hypothetical protein